MKYGTVEGSKLVKHEKESSKLRMGGGSWTINLDTLPEHVTDIEYVTDKATYRISRSEAFENGFVRILAGEKKLVVPLHFWIYEK